MKNYSASEIRNVVVLGHSGCGKTSIVEAALNIAGVTSRLGKVTDGNTVSDYDQEETKRHVSINTSVIPVEWLDSKINFLDTPGYFDYVGEVKEALSAADIALIVLNAKSGIEVGTEKAWEFASSLNLPKIIFVNGMDDENADFDKVVEDLKRVFGKSIAPLQAPFKENDKFAGFVNAIKKEGRRFVNGRTSDCEMPDHMADIVHNLHLMICEAVAETSDELMEKFFAEEPFTIEEIDSGIKQGLSDGSVTPVFCGAATTTMGVRVLMNSIVSYCPPAAELCKEIDAFDYKTGNPVKIKCEEKESLSAFVFKTIADPYVGRLTIFRVLSGVIHKDTPLYNPRTDFVEKAGHLYVLRGKEQIEVDELRAGDIGAIAKLQNTATTDTLCYKDKQYSIKRIEFPESLYSMAITPNGKGDEDKLAQAISKLLEEDKTVKFEINTETHQSILSTVGDSQMDVLISKLKNKYKIDVTASTPIVPYREMIKGKSKVQGKYKKQSGGHGQYGDVHMEFEPSGDTSSSYIFEEKIFGGSVPRQYFPAVEKGIQECVKAGPLAYYPVVGIKCTLVDGSYHPVDSSEMAFKMATVLAFKDGFMKAKPTILEPIAHVVVSVPDDYTGDIMGDMNKRRGKILGMGKKGTKQEITAEAPLAEMFRYSTELKSMTQGRGSFTMAFDRYEEAPNDIQQKVIEARKKEKEHQEK